MPAASSYPVKTTPIPADSFLGIDSAASNAVKRMLWSAIQSAPGIHYVPGGTNITTAIQAANTAAVAAGGGVIWIGPGLSTTAPVTLGTNVTLRGSDREATRLRPVSGSYPALTYLVSLTSISVKDVIVRDITIDCQDIVNMGGIKFDNTNVSGDSRHRIYNVNVRYTREGEAGINFGNQCRDGLVAFCDIRDSSTGMITDGSDFTCMHSVLAGSRDGPNLLSIGPNQRFIGVKCFYSGYDFDITGTPLRPNRYNHPNFLCYGTRNIAYVGCESQDAGGHGFEIGRTGQNGMTDVTLSGCISECSNAADLNDGANGDAYHFSNISRGTMVGSISKNTTDAPNNQHGQQEWGIGFSGFISEIDVTAAGSQQGTLGTVEASAATSGLSVLLTGTATYNPSSIAAGAQTTTTVTVTGAKLSGSNTVGVGFSNDLQGMQITAYVSSDNTVTVVLRNGTAGAIDLASGTLRASVRRYA